MELEWNTCLNLSTTVVLDDDDDGDRGVEFVLVIESLLDSVASDLDFIIILRGDGPEVGVGVSNRRSKEPEMGLRLEAFLIFFFSLHL